MPLWKSLKGCNLKANSLIKRLSLIQKEKERYKRKGKMHGYDSYGRKVTQF